MNLIIRRCSIGVHLCVVHLTHCVQVCMSTSASGLGCVYTNPEIHLAVGVGPVFTRPIFQPNSVFYL